MPTQFEAMFFSTQPTANNDSFWYIDLSTESAF